MYSVSVCSVCSVVKKEQRNRRTQMNAIEILRHFDIELERQYFNSSGEEMFALCPYHEEKTPSFSLNVEKGVFYCFGCGESGNIYHLVEHLTGLPYSEVRKAVFSDGIPEFHLKPLPKSELKILCDVEVDALTLYSQVAHRLLRGYHCTNPNDLAVTVYQDYLEQRGVSMKAAEHFQLGANRYSYLSYGKSPKHQLWVWEMMNKDLQDSNLVSAFENMNLINRRRSDYWFKPAILIPYQYQGEVYWMNARHIPPYDEEVKYMGMKGIKHVHLFNEDALSEFDEVFVVEGEMNAVLMWDRGCKNVVSFGSKRSLTEAMIERLWGKHVIYYEDKDKNDLAFSHRAEMLAKIQRIAKSVAFFEMEDGEDPASFLRDHSWHDFENEVIPMLQYPYEPTDWQPHEIRPRLDKPTVITLKQAQEKNKELFENLSVNLPAYSGQVILCNMAVGTIKTTSAINGINVAHVPSLVAIGQHNLANDYESQLQVPSVLHLYGRAHPAVGCDFHRVAMKLCGAGYSYYFKKNYCCGVCKKAKDCKHFNQQEQARLAHTLLVTHAHTQLFDFLTNPYYSNDIRRFVIMDELPELTREVAFSFNDIHNNINILSVLLGKIKMGMSLVDVSIDVVDAFYAQFAKLKDSLLRGEDFCCVDWRISRRDLKGILKAIKPNENADILPRLMLSELAYAVNNQLRLEYTLKSGVPVLRYTWRPKFSSQATIVFLSATTTKDYLAKQLGREVNVVIGEQYYVQRKNLHVAQLVNLSGSRTRIANVTSGNPMSDGDEEFRKNLSLFLQMVFKKHVNQRILIVTSLGCKDNRVIKEQVIDTFQSYALEANRHLVAVSARDLEKDIEFLKMDVPVIHYGMLGTNLFANFDVCIELNAHYYNPSAIIEGIKTEFGIELDTSRFKKYVSVFQTLDQEYMVSRWGYFDPKYPDYTDMVDLFLDNNQRADMVQAEGRILRGDDVQKWIYRLHNVNIPPYPNAVHRSWITFLKAEFGYVNPKAVKGNVRKALEWIEKNASTREFTVVELTEALGGYRHLWIKTLNRLQDLGFVEVVFDGNGRGNPSRWKSCHE